MGVANPLRVELMPLLGSPRIRQRSRGVGEQFQSSQSLQILHVVRIHSHCMDSRSDA